MYRSRSNTAVLPTFAGLVLLLALPALALGNVVVKRQPVAMAYKTFDPAHPPSDMPHLKAGEAAVTESVFRCATNVNSEVLSRKHQDDGGCMATVRVRQIELTLELQLTIWLPDGATDKLRDHEEGHRRISEQVYALRAEAAARKAASPADGRRLSGEAADCEGAAKAAMGTAVHETADRYLAGSAAVADEVNNVYDDLTGHGTNKLAEDDAIRQAFARYEKNHPSDKPTGDRGASRKNDERKSER